MNDRRYSVDGVKACTIAAPPSALAGLTEKHDAALAEALNIKSIKDLGSNKYVALAVALAQLGEKQG